MLLCVAMLLASDDNLVRLYNFVLPIMALMLINFVATQHFLESTCFAQRPTDWWSQLMSYLSRIVGKDRTWSCDWYHEVLFVVAVTTQLAVSTVLVSIITLNSSRAERITLTALTSLLTVPSFMKIVGAPTCEVVLTSAVVFLTACWGMELWSNFCLERMIYSSVRSMYENAHRHPGRTLSRLWSRTRRLLFISWLIAFSAQFIDSLLQAPPSNLSYAEMMWFNLRHKSWTPMMYLGLCSAIGYLTDAVWKSVYRVVALSAAHQDVTDHGLSELGALVALRLIGLLLGMSATDMFFAIPFLVGPLTAEWTLRSVTPLLTSVDRPTVVRASAVYLLMIVLVPCVVVASISFSGYSFNYVTGNLVIVALRISVKAASILAQSLVTRCSTATEDPDELNFIIRVSIIYTDSALSVRVSGCLAVPVWQQWVSKG